MTAFRLTPLRRQTDEALMVAVARGHERAFNELYRRYARRLQGFFALRAGGEVAAADLVQELFLRLWAARASYEPGRPVAPWLFTLAYNLLRNELRHRSVEAEYAGSMAAAGEAVDGLAGVRLDDEAFDRALSAVLEGLPDEARLLFALRYEQGFPLADIATVLAVPLGTVKSRLHRLVQVLHRKLKDYA